MHNMHCICRIPVAGYYISNEKHTCYGIPYLNLPEFGDSFLFFILHTIISSDLRCHGNRECDTCIVKC